MKKISYIFLSLLLATTFTLQAQSFKLDNEASTLSVFGTSTLHDWKLSADDLKGDAVFKMKGNKIEEISSLSFEVPVAPMESGLEALDKHMRTAMTANNSSVVTFIMNEVTKLTPNTIDGYTVQANGNLTIIKNKKPVSLQATIEIKKDGAIRIYGETKISMTDYEVEPPQAEMGSIKTEDEVKVVFDVVFVK